MIITANAKSYPNLNEGKLACNKDPDCEYVNAPGINNQLTTIGCHPKEKINNWKKYLHVNQKEEPKATMGDTSFMDSNMGDKPRGTEKNNESSNYSNELTYDEIEFEKIN